MLSDVIWATWNGDGLEHLRLRPATEGGIIADSALITVVDDTAYRVRYRARIDERWRTRSIWVDIEDGDGSRRTVALLGDGEGNWTDTAGEPRLDLDGCIDIDIQVTPFTNTLPIRRLAIAPGQEHPISVVYFAIPNLEVTPQVQRYFGTDTGYRYESLTRTFVKDLEVDRDGLIVTYPDLFRRVWAGGEE